MALADDILRRVRGHGRGFVFCARDLIDLGSRAAVDQALARMTHQGAIRRIDRGVYDLPRLHPRIGPLWPSAESVARALARQEGSHIKASGSLAANALGLTTQVPAQVVYLTDGPARSVQIGRLQVALRHAGRVEMLLPDTRAGLAIVALAHLGRAEVSPEIVARLAASLDQIEKERLREVRPEIPGWLGDAIAQVAA